MFKKLFDPSYKEFKKCEKLADQVLALEDEYAKLTDDELKAKTPEFKERITPQDLKQVYRKRVLRERQNTKRRRDR